MRDGDTRVWVIESLKEGPGEEWEVDELWFVHATKEEAEESIEGQQHGTWRTRQYMPVNECNKLMFQAGERSAPLVRLLSVSRQVINALRDYMDNPKKSNAVRLSLWGAVCMAMEDWDKLERSPDESDE